MEVRKGLITDLHYLIKGFEKLGTLPHFGPK
jgi:hypothetical protein